MNPKDVKPKSYIGKRGTIKLKNGLLIEVRIRQHKFVYGNDRFLVSPVAGQGEVWVQTIELK